MVRHLEAKLAHLYKFQEGYAFAEEIFVLE